MRRTTQGIVLVSTWLLGACSAAAPAVTTRTPSSSAPNTSAAGWTSQRGIDMHGALYDNHGKPLVSSSTTFDGPRPETDRFASTSIGPAETATAPRPRGVGKRNIFLRGARLDNALRMLARVGKFNLVVQGDIAETVTVALRAVEPYDAARVLVFANNLSMQYRHGIVIVKRRTNP